MNTLTITDADLHVLENELARHVGPLARLLVKKAAKRAGSLHQLIAALEEEIPTEDARHAFRAAVRKLR
jgi:Ni,Fe-hydrogenase I large subunit